MRLKPITSALLASLLVTGSVLAAQEEAEGPPPGPAPRNAEGRALLGGATPAEKGVWPPGFNISTPIAPIETLPMKDWTRALFEDRQRHELEPHARCKASGISRQFTTPYGVEFVEIPELGRVYIFDIGGPHTFRTIYTDGRQHPADLEPTNYGHSIGHWEGDTLVVDTVGYNEDFWLDRRGTPHTDQIHTVERFTRVNQEAIAYELTVDDPGAYDAVWTGSRTLRWEAGVELFEYMCQQANYAHELMVGEEVRAVDRSSPIVP